MPLWPSKPNGLCSLWQVISFEKGIPSVLGPQRPLETGIRHCISRQSLRKAKGDDRIRLQTAWQSQLLITNTNSPRQTQTHVHMDRYTASGAEMSFAQSMHKKIINFPDTESADPVTLELVNVNKLLTKILKLAAEGERLFQKTAHFPVT